MRAAVLAIGSEIVTGRIVDTNSSFLARKLWKEGVETVLHLSCPDRDGPMFDALGFAAERASLVVCTGGLGPTEDDRTRDVVARFADRELVEDEDALARIEEVFRRFDRPMPASNHRQALLPEGAAIIENPRGTAPGFALDVGGTRVVCLPGVPRELEPLWDEAVRDLVREALPPGERVRSTEVATWGWTEARVDEAVAAALASEPAVERSTLATRDGIFCHLRSRSADALVRAEAACREALGPIVFGGEGDTLASVCLEGLRRTGRTLALAESCTGGRAAARLTGIPGASAAFLGGVVAYADEAKTELLGVSTELLAEHGAVSAPVARAMAEGARERLGADVAGSVTGVAGPGGGTEEKPVGLVYVGRASDRSTEARELTLAGDRARIQRLSVLSLLDLVRRGLDRSEGVES